MDPLVEKIRKEIERGRPVRRKLPGGGRMYIDRPLPFLCLYRTRPNGRDRGTRKLLSGEASFLIAPGDHTYHEPLRELVENACGDIVEEIRGLLVARGLGRSPRQPSGRRSRTLFQGFLSA